MDCYGIDIEVMDRERRNALGDPGRYFVIFCTDAGEHGEKQAWVPSRGEWVTEFVY